MIASQEDAREPNRFGGRRLLQDLSAGVILAPITIVVGMSLASLAYAGTPDTVMAQGVGFVLIGTLIFNLIMAWRSTLPGAITLPQDSPAAIIGVVTAGIVASMGVSAAESSVFATIVAAVVMSSLATGLLLILLGALNLGNIVRYLPYPVVGEFLAGDVLFRQNTPAPGLFFLVSGQLTAQIERPNAMPLRVRTVHPGVFVGEPSFYAETDTSASIVADRPSVVYHLPAATVAHLAEADPALAAALHLALAQLMSKRLISATNTIRNLRS